MYDSRGQVVDYNRHCKYEYGNYVQVHTQNVPTNVVQERMIDCIYLRPNENNQGGHILMNLNTGKRITRGRVTEIPLPQMVKEKVEQMADYQGIKVMTYAGCNRVKYADVEDQVDDNNNVEENNEVSRDDDDEERCIRTRVSYHSGLLPWICG